MKLLINIVITILVLFTGCVNTKDTKKKESKATQVIYRNGEIITMEGSRASTQEVVVVEGKRIMFVGSEADALETFPNAQAYDLDGNTMMPGFIEQHMHPFLGALTLAMPVIAPEDWVLPTKTWPAANSNDEYLSQLRAIETEMEKPDEVLFSWGYHQFFHGTLNRSILDEVSATRPIAIWHRSVHEFYLNSAMIDLLKLDQEGINATGNEARAQSDLTNGHFFENGALLYLLPRIAPHLGTQERFVFGLNQMVELLHQKGVTAYNEPGAFIFPGTEQLYMKILGAESTPMYSYFIPETKTPFKTDPDNVLNLVQEITNTFP